MTPKPNAGFSLIELLLVVLIIGILLAIGSFIFNRQSLELSRATRDLKSFAQSARFEAIRANQNAYLVVQERQVQFFVDANQNGILDSGEKSRTLEASSYSPLLRFTANFSGESGFRWNNTGLPTQLSSEGFSAGLLNLNLGSQSSCVVMSAGGRLRQGSVGECA